jgi:selenocysteine lyase/cysteine desulfurase
MNATDSFISTCDSFTTLPGVNPAWIRAQLIGQDAIAQTPFGERRIVYADYVASGRSLEWIENFILKQVLPLYANTHTEDSATGARMTSMAHDASNYIKQCLGAQNGKLLFCGTGSTATIKRLQAILGLVVPESLRERVIASLDSAERPIVFVGPYEHHSNEVTWRETIAEVMVVPLDSDGAIDLKVLRDTLHALRRTKRPLYGSFSAASNVTGVLTDTRGVARLLHEYGALAFFDFAAAAPHAEIDMRIGQRDGYDAVFISTHKFVGGPGSPGILVFNPALYRLRAPSTAGGGTVSYVNCRKHYFVDDIEQRESAGTPGVVQSIRAALAFLVKESVGTQTIERLESAMIRSAIARLRRHPRIELLGNLDVPRLAILSFLVRTADGNYLHPRLVVRLLNDLFGIQSRGGCACAGPYAHRLLEINAARAEELRDAVLDGFESVKPGWTRLNFSYFIEPEEFEFLLDAIEFIADHGERFIAEYECDWHSGGWHHRRDEAQPDLLTMVTRPAPLRVSRPMLFHDCIARARVLLENLTTRSNARRVPQQLPAALVSFQY